PSGPVRIIVELPPIPREMDPTKRAGGEGAPRLKVPEKDKAGAPIKSEKDLPEAAPLFHSMPEVEQRAWESVMKIPKCYFDMRRTPLQVMVNPTTDPPPPADLKLTTKNNIIDPEDLRGGLPEKPPVPTPPGQ